MKAATVAAALFLALALGACSGGSDQDMAMPATPPAAPAKPELLVNAIRMDDGVLLPLRAWLPKEKIRAVVLALHGFNDYSHAFEGVGKAFVEQGIATYAYDQRGFGNAPGHGRWAGTRRLAQDLAEAARLLRARHPGLPFYILGESMGGAVAIVGSTGVAGAQKPVCDGLILTAPAVWDRSHMSILERGALWLAYNVVPGMTLSGKGLRILASDNIEMLKELGRDPLVIKETRVDAIEGLVELMSAAFAAGPKLDRHALILYGAHDEVIPETPVRDFVKSLPPEPAARRRLAYYKDGYHMLTRDLKSETVLADIVSWIDRPAAGLPSGADEAVPADWR